MDIPPKLSISLVNTNNREFLQACLRSLFQMDQGIRFEVLLVDNVSTDGSQEMVRSEFPQVRLLQNEIRRGFGANHNQAIRLSKGEYILVLNEDTIIKEEALKRMCDYLDSDPAAGAVGCRLENPDGTLQLSCYRFPSPARALAENLLLVAAFPNNRWWGDHRSWTHDQVRYVDFVSGAAIMVRHEIVRTVGVFDEQFFIYAEETDWCFRMSKAGWRIAFIPAATIIHYGGQSSAKIKNRQFCEFNRSARKYIQKHYGSKGVIVHHISMVLGAAVRIPLWSAIYAIARKRRRVAAEKIVHWARLLRWWTGFGPRAGIAELVQSRKTPEALG